jgi:hypothetical protein
MRGDNLTGERRPITSQQKETGDTFELFRGCGVEFADGVIPNGCKRDRRVLIDAIG